MRSKRVLYGLMGLLSLLGFVGVFTEERAFLAFFAFAVDFQYFFIKSDEMMDEYMNKSASRAFCCGMIATAVASLAALALSSASEALLTGFAAGWAVSVIVYAVSTSYYVIKENWGLERD